jgi:hypothetical protein
MTMKPRKTISIADIQRKYDCMIDEYKEVTGIAYDPSNGTDQIPDNHDAWMVYGCLDALGAILEDAGV